MRNPRKCSLTSARCAQNAASRVGRRRLAASPASAAAGRSAAERCVRRIEMGGHQRVRYQCRRRVTAVGRKLRARSRAAKAGKRTWTPVRASAAVDPNQSAASQSGDSRIGHAAATSAGQLCCPSRMHPDSVQLYNCRKLRFRRIVFGTTSRRRRASAERPGLRGAPVRRGCA